MANRFPLVVDSSNQNIKELPDGDSLLLGDSEKLILGDGLDLQLYHSSGNSYIDNNKGALFIRNNVDDDDNNNIILQAKSGEYSILCDDDGAVTLYHDNSAKIATASGGVSVTGNIAISGDITGADIDLDASGDINLDAGGGDWRLIDDGTTICTISNVSGDLQLLLGTQDKDFKFQVNDGGSQLDALVLDASLSGQAVSLKSARIGQQALTSSSNAVAWDAAAAANAYHVTTENTTFSAPSNAVEGAIISVEIAQGGTARTVAWNTVFEFAASTAPVVTATANKTDIFAFRYNGSVWQEIGRVQNMAQT